MFDYSLFLELHFFLMSLSTIILFVWFIVPYFYLADLMRVHKYTSNDASFTLSNIGVANTIGMVCNELSSSKFSVTFHFRLISCIFLGILGLGWR